MLNFVGDSTEGTHMGLGDQSQQRGWYGQLTLVAPQLLQCKEEGTSLYTWMKFF